VYFLFQAEDGIRDRNVTGVQTCALPILGFRYFVLISGDTLPLYPAETIRTVLREAYARGRQFISANPSITPEEADRIRRRRFCRSEERRVGKEGGGDGASHSGRVRRGGE